MRWPFLLVLAAVFATTVLIGAWHLALALVVLFATAALFEGGGQSRRGRRRKNEPWDPFRDFYSDRPHWRPHD